MGGITWLRGGSEKGVTINIDSVLAQVSVWLCRVSVRRWGTILQFRGNSHTSLYSCALQEKSSEKWQRLIICHSPRLLVNNHPCVNVSGSVAMWEKASDGSITGLDTISGPGPLVIVSAITPPLNALDGLGGNLGSILPPTCLTPVKLF